MVVNDMEVSKERSVSYIIKGERLITRKLKLKMIVKDSEFSPETPW